MITLLGTTLDGVAGLSVVDSRTVLARWDEVVGENQRPDLAAVLQVARRAGARYTLVGTAFTALVLKDTATAAEAMAAQADEPYSAFYHNFLDGLWLWETEGPAAAESAPLASYAASSGGDFRWAVPSMAAGRAVRAAG